MTLLAGARTDTPDEYGFAVGGWYLHHPENLAADTRVMVDAHATYARHDLDWPGLQWRSAAQPYQWARYDRIFRGFQDAGLRSIAILRTHSPPFATADRRPLSPYTNEADYRRYCYQAARRTIGFGVRHFEIGNEVNLFTLRHRPDPAGYVRHYLIPCSQEVRRAAAAAGVLVTVLFAGLAPGDLAGAIRADGYLASAYAAGARGHFDVMAYHPYAGDDPRRGFNITTLPDLVHDVMEANGDGGRTIWATEYGVPTSGSGSVSEARQAEHVRIALASWRAHRYAGPLLWYALRDQRAYGSGRDREDYFGVLRLDGTRKAALAELTERFGR